MLANLLQINIWEVIQTASTKPFGFTPFYPTQESAGTVSLSIHFT